jgi:hypothetical protein
MSHKSAQEKPNEVGQETDKGAGCLSSASLYTHNQIIAFFAIRTEIFHFHCLNFDFL